MSSSREEERARQARRREHREHLNRQKALRSSWLVGSKASEAPRDTAGGEAAEKEEEAGTTAVPRVPPPAPTAAPARARKPPQSSPSSLTLISSGILTVDALPGFRTSLPDTLTSLNLHSNQLTSLAGLEMLAQLEDLNLSSNLVEVMDAFSLAPLRRLKTLNLMSNRLRRGAGWRGSSPCAR